MIVNELYNGSGLGNQLWRYTVTRVIALKNGYDFGIMNPHKCKASKIFNLDFGNEVVGGDGPEGGPPITLPEGIEKYYEEKSLIHPVYQCDCRLYDPGLVNILDNTKIDGNMESEKYLEGYKDDVRKWFKIKEDKQYYGLSSPDICILGFRGGEYVGVNELFLPPSYWYNAMNIMKSRNPNMVFKVVTDDPRTAKMFFPNLDVYHYNTQADWILIRNAQNIIMSNSSFAWIATWINDGVKNVIAPKFWARHNVSDGFWAQGDSLTKGWEYLDRNGDMFSYDDCLSEKQQYEKDNSHIYAMYGSE